MAYTFTVGQSPLNPALVELTDTSTGVDVSVTSRRAYIQDCFGNYYVPDGTTTDYTVWPLANNSILLDVLDTDIAALITVQWLDVSDNVVAETSGYFCLSEYNKAFYVSLFGSQAVTPALVKDRSYFGNLAILWQNIVGANKAVEIGADIASSQNCLARANNMRNNSEYYF